MYLHIGNSVVVPASEVLGIFDVSLNTSSSTKEFLQYHEEKNVVVISEEKDSKSFVVTTEKVYYSPIAPNTLKKRMEGLSLQS